MHEFVTLGEIIEEREVDPEIREMFAAFEREEGDWKHDDTLPSSTTSRVFAATVFWAATHRTRWRVFYMRYYLGLDVCEIALHMGHTERYVRQLLAPVHYSEIKDAIVDGFRANEKKTLNEPLKNYTNTTKGI